MYTGDGQRKFSTAMRKIGPEKSGPIFRITALLGDWWISHAGDLLDWILRTGVSQTDKPDKSAICKRRDSGTLC